MIEGNRRRVVGCVEEDRISNLPEHLIDLILECLPIEDAVRTSILSKRWRYRWTTMRALVFDEHFSKIFAKNGAFGHNGFIRIINQVFFLHKGPILKFHLHIPDISLDTFQEVDQWILFLSRNGVRELVLTNSNECYKLPCYLFSCLQLTKLYLENCFFKPPLEFEGFPNLDNLDLRNIDFGPNLSQINLPVLKTLYLIRCTNVYNFNIKATNLHILLVHNCPDAMFLRLLHTSPCLDEVGMCIQKPIEDNVRIERITLEMMLSNLTKTEGLYVNGLLFKVVITEKIPKWLPNAVMSLKHLCLLDLQLGDLDQLEGALCLLRNSRNLESLTVRPLEKPQVIDYDVGPALDHLEAPNCLDCTLSRLQNVAIEYLEGSRLEMLFIKLLLAHSPCLEELAITPSDAEKRLDILKDVMGFPRASPKAKVCLDPNP